jgi:hypothetical protein
MILKIFRPKMAANLANFDKKYCLFMTKITLVYLQKLGRPTKFHQKSRIGSKVIQQSLGDGQTDRQMTSPYPYTGGRDFFSV